MPDEDHAPGASKESGGGPEPASEDQGPHAGLHGPCGLGLPEMSGLGLGRRVAAAAAPRLIGGVRLWRLRAPGASAARGASDLEARGGEPEAHATWIRPSDISS